MQKALSGVKDIKGKAHIAECAADIGASVYEFSDRELIDLLDGLDRVMYVAVAVGPENRRCCLSSVVEFAFALEVGWRITSICNFGTKQIHANNEEMLSM